MIFIILDVSIGALHQQSSDYPGLSVDGGDHERCLPCIISDVQVDLRKSQHVYDYIFVPFVSSPVQGRTTPLIRLVDADSILEVDESGNFIVLSTHQHDVEFGVIMRVNVRAKGFQIFDKVDVSVE